MKSGRHIATLCWKNALLKVRHPFGLIVELVLPLLFILLFSYLKSELATVDVPAGWSSDTPSCPPEIPADDCTQGSRYSLDAPYNVRGVFPAFLPDTFYDVGKYYEREPSMSGFLFALSRVPLFNVSEEHKKLCAGFLTGEINPPPTGCPLPPSLIAVVASNKDFFDYFNQTVSLWHPNIAIPALNLTVSGVKQFFIHFPSTQSLDEYIASPSYGSGPESPRIFAAIEFYSAPTVGKVGKWEYGVRLNSTRFSRELPTSPIFGGAFDTLKAAVDKVTKGVNSYPMLQAVAGGHVTLQTMVNKFILCNPKTEDLQARKVTCSNAKATTTIQDKRAFVTDKLLTDPIMRSYLKPLFLLLKRLGTNVDPFSLIDNAAIEAFSLPYQQLPASNSFYNFPTASYRSSQFYTLAATVFPLAFVLAYLYSVSRILVAFIREKELKFRELTKIMGVSDSGIIVSWYITYAVLFLISSLMMAGVSLVNVFPSASFGGLFCLYFFFGLDVIAFCFFLSTMFSKAKTGAVVGVVLFFLSYMVYNASSDPTSSPGSKALTSILPPVALAQGISVLSAFATTETPLTASAVVNNFSFGAVIGLMVFDFVFYTLLGAYFDQTLPKEWGVRQGWCFCFSPRYWGLKTQRKKPSVAPKESKQAGKDFEPVSKELEAQELDGRALRVVGLQKVFKTPVGPKVALKNLDLNLYENQITCLLGHNGAGKTTTISILCGLLDPTKGDAYFRGLSLSENLLTIRKSMGVCPQHDVLYEDLTVIEHLRLFGSIKGLKGQELMDECTKKIAEVGLTEKRTVKSSQLSGGMKRKLSLAIALIGDSKLVFLDEPTSGMDPYSRRSTWDVIKNNREGRVIILTTHFMDEADLLGDRIAIMSGGELKCCGSSLFLKHRFGVGYNLTVVKREAGGREATASAASALQTLISQHIPSARKLSEVGSEVAFQLPLDANSNFPAMFKEFDNRSAELGLLSYGISVTTMEEVFIKVSEKTHENTQKPDKVPASGSSPTSSFPSMEPMKKSTFRVKDVGHRSLFLTHLRALFLKRLRYAKRDSQSLCCSTLMPLLMLLLGFLILISSNRGKPGPRVVLDSSLFAMRGRSGPAEQVELRMSYICHGREDKDNGMCSPLRDSFPSSAGVSFKALTLTPPANSQAASYFDLSYNLSALSEDQAMALQASNASFEAASSLSLSQYGTYVFHLDEANNSISATIGVNSSALLGAPLFHNLLHSALYSWTTGDKDASISVSSHPLPLTQQTSAVFTTVLAFTASTFILIAISFIPANIITLVVKEKENTHNSKHLQMVSGASLSAYWIANFLWDFTVYLVTFIAALVLLQAFKISAFTGINCTGQCASDPFGATALLFFTFGLSIVPITFLFSFLFSTHTVAQYVALFIAFITGLGGIIATSVMDNIASVKDISASLKHFLRLLPTYALGEGLINMVVGNLRSALSNAGNTRSAFDWELAGAGITYMAVTPWVYLLLTILIDYILCQESARAWIPFLRDPVVQDKPFEEDEDVLKEKKRIQDGKAAGDLLRVEGIRKVYRTGKVAVKDLWFGLPAGACFGFLGINGAGKSTTMKIMTGDEIPSQGRGFIDDRSIVSEQILVRRLVGYCPQFDALLDLLSVREHLELFAAIRGVPSGQIPMVVAETMQAMDLVDFEHKLAHTLSGGNKRKLSVGIALIGSPPVLFLDEPSTGMDPVARRFMWSVIARVSTVDRESTVILTTHSMEECEALCNSVGIMVGGRLRCLGSIQHLKDRFGQGLMLEIKGRDPPKEELEGLMKKIGKEDLKKDDISAVCASLDNTEREKRLHEEGWQIETALNKDGKVSCSLFANWWLLQEHFETLRNLLERNFTGVKLLERHDLKSRWRVDKGEQRLSEIFEALERMKQTVDMPEYSVSQVSLEQVFNQFAAQQEEETGRVRGMAN